MGTCRCGATSTSTLGFVVDDFTRGVAMMRKRDRQVQEDGFEIVKRVAAEHVADLVAAYEAEFDHGLRCWLLELIGETRSPAAIPILAEALADKDDSIRDWAKAGLEKVNAKEARNLLWHREHPEV